jgi:uncharacterized protein YhbP (UPF0306 family)
MEFNTEQAIREVHYVYDDELNLYWRSLPSRRHSQEIAHNPNIAGNIIQQHAVGEKPQGVYFEGTAEILQGITLDDLAYKLYSERFGSGPDIIDQQADPNGNHFYKITVQKFYMFDARQSSPAQKYELNWKD